MNVKPQNVFPTSDAIWNIQINGKEYYFGLSGDTIINDMLYNKLYLLNDTTLNIDSEDEYVGAFRQEGGKVWYRPSNFSLCYNIGREGETLLYDFSKNIGDTIWHNLIYEEYAYYIDENITASKVYDIIDSGDGRIVKTEQYSCGSYPEIIGWGKKDSWKEGIGSLNSGLFWFLYEPPMDGGWFFKLICFKQGNEVKYIDNPVCNSCFCWSSTEILEKENIPLKVVYENNSIQVKGESSVFPCELKLFSLIGQLILEKKLQSDKDEISINQLKGIWLYQIQKNSEIVKTGKLIIK